MAKFAKITPGADWGSSCVHLGGCRASAAGYLYPGSGGESAGAAPAETHHCFLNQVHSSQFPHSPKSQPCHTPGVGASVGL